METSQLNMSGPISKFINQPLLTTNAAHVKSNTKYSNQNSNMMLKTTTTAITPMNVTQVNSTKNKLSKNFIQAKYKSSKLIRRAQPKQCQSNLKKSISSQSKTILGEESIRTKARRFIQNDLSADVRLDSMGNQRKLMIYTKQNIETREIRDKSYSNEESEHEFCTEGADSSHFQRYIVGKKIGQGAYATVRAGIDTISNRKVAIKIYDKLNLLDNQRRKGVRREIKLLERMNHENIIGLYEAFDNKKQVFLVMESANGGSLHSLLKSRSDRKLKDDEARRIFKQIASAIQYCHSKNITHRDIKLENILLDESKQNVKLIDFGFST